MIYGREVAKTQLSDVIATAAGGRGAAVVVQGEAGIGKSALLEYAAGLHRGRLLHVTGTETEADLPFAALHALLRPHLLALDRLPGPQADALRAAFGRTPVRGHDRFLTGLAVLTLLADLAEEQPVLCLIDDAQWVDQASADALLFAVRRLHAERIAVVFGVRTGDRPFRAAGLPEITLAGLDAVESAALLRDPSVASGEISPAVRDRVVAESEGNPLALIELSRMLDPDQLAGKLPALGLYTEASSPAGRVERAFHDRIGALPDRTRALLVVAAAEGTGDLELVARAAVALGSDAADLAPAEDAGLVRVSGGALVFRHPLVKAAAYRGSALSLRQAAHRALAAVLALGDVEDGVDAQDRRAHQLAAAALGTDEGLGFLVEGAADRAARRGAPAVAAAAYERAAQLSADRELRARRLARAAESSAAAGNLGRAGEIAARGLRLTQDPEIAARLVAVTAALEFEQGNAAAAGRAVVDAVEAIVATAPDTAVSLLGSASGYAWFAGDGASLHRASRLLETVQRHSDAPLGQVSSVVRGTELLLSGDHTAGLRLLRTSPPDADPATGSPDAVAATYAVFGALRTGDDSAALELAGAFARTCREQGLIGELTHALQLKTQTEIFVGRHSEAESDAAEALDIARAVNQGRRARHVQGILALLAAIEGDAERCEELAGSGIEGGLAPGASWGGYALGLLALGRGDHEAAASRLTALLGSPVGHTVIVRFAVPTLVEAHARLGAPERAVAPFAHFEGWAQAGGRPWALGVAARCRALLGPSAEAESNYEAALGHHANATRPFEHARTLLLYGEWLRRARRRKDAATRLRAAAEVFGRLGAAPWLERATVELAAIGARPRATSSDRVVDELDALTPQERQVVRLAATGAGNQEIASQLFLSPRTVAYHLYNAFPKLGVTSRVELARFAASA